MITNQELFFFALHASVHDQVSVNDFKHPSRCKWHPSSSGMLRSVDWYLVTDVSGRFLRGQAFQVPFPPPESVTHNKRTESNSAVVTTVTVTRSHADTYITIAVASGWRAKRGGGGTTICRCRLQFHSYDVSESLLYSAYNCYDRNLYGSVSNYLSNQKQKWQKSVDCH